MKSEHNRRTAPAGPTCWQREAPCACLRIETSDRAAQVFPYQHLVTASLDCADEAEILRLTFSTHDVEITGQNLRALLVAVQDLAVKWVRVMPERYHQLDAGENGVVSRIRIKEAD
jgi:hypothetical protein